MIIVIKTTLVGVFDSMNSLSIETNVRESLFLLIEALEGIKHVVGGSFALEYWVLI